MYKPWSLRYVERYLAGPDQSFSQIIGIPQFLQLYEALHVGEHQLKRQRELQETLEKLNAQITPLEEVGTEILTGGDYFN